ncbi:MAG: leucine-rich repeat domain-containing protein [Clostridiales bacterium]|nr:leucine-rich repeat domain-containing protein [Clostridiales bacterium]
MAEQVNVLIYCNGYGIIINMKNKIFSLFVCLAMVLAVNGFVSCSKQDTRETITLNGIEYMKSDNANEYFVYRAANKNITDAAISAEINSMPVISIGRADAGWLIFPFENCKSLTNVVIPNSITIIGYGAFRNCSALTNISLSTNITEIYLHAFSGCSSLTTVDIPNSVTQIGAGSFAGCANLTDITLPNAITKIPYQMFDECSQLTTVTIPNGVTIIENKAFMNCIALESIYIPDTVTTMQRMLFGGCVKLEKLRIPNSVEIVEEYLTFDCKGMTMVYLPKSIKKIERQAFGFNDSRYVPNIHYESAWADWENVDVKWNEGNNQYKYESNFTFNSYPANWNTY